MIKNIKILQIALLSIILFSCATPNSSNTTICNKWKLGYTVDDGWNVNYIICDSLDMTSDTTVNVWNNGRKTRIFAQRFYPLFKPCK